MDKPSPYGHILQSWASNLPSQLRGHFRRRGPVRVGHPQLSNPARIAGRMRMARQLVVKHEHERGRGPFRKRPSGTDDGDGPGRQERRR